MPRPGRSRGRFARAGECFSAPEPERRAGARELVVRFLWGEGEDAVMRDIRLDLRCVVTRAPTGRLRVQRGLLVLGAGRRATPGPCVRVTLTAPARAFLASLGGGAAPPPAGCPRLLRPGS